MICFPNGKINLGLRISGQREDGYHDIETVFYPIAINDVVEAVPAAESGIILSGLPVDGKTNENLCVKAYGLLKTDFPDLPPVNIFLHKVIPAGAGLGGGSADGAFMILLLNKLFELNLSKAQRLQYALKLGSDCPFFMINRPCHASGRGEILEQIDLDLSGYSFMLVHSDLHISTSWAYSQVIPDQKVTSIKESIAKPVHFWKESLKNDFEGPVFFKHPNLKTIKEKLYMSGALYSAMTGSGSCVFGIFEKNHLPLVSFENNFSVFALK
jgi:4-diphosphocytidyl-2-C-methyl-D-erythritol kinase